MKGKVNGPCNSQSKDERVKRHIWKLTTEPTDEPILGTRAEADAWGRRKFIKFQKLPQFFTHYSLVLWRRSPFQNWLLSWSSRLLNQGVRYFPFLFECWVFAFFFGKKRGNSKPVKCDVLCEISDGNKWRHKIARITALTFVWSAMAEDVSFTVILCFRVFFGLLLVHFSTG